jgi:nitrous oxide reductase accessory protein NosL
MKTFLTIVIIRAAFVALVSCTRAYDGNNPRQIMIDMLDAYSYMSYAEHVEPFDFHKWSGYELQRNLSCEKLDTMTKIDLTPEKCKGLFLLYWGL